MYIHTKKQPSCSKHALLVTYPHVDAIFHHNYLFLIFPSQKAAVCLPKLSPTKQLQPKPSFHYFNETLREQSQPFQTFRVVNLLKQLNIEHICNYFFFTFMLAMSVPSLTIHEDC